MTETQPEPLVWRHLKTGGHYLLAMRVTREADLEELIVYKSLSDGRRWARPASEFFDGRFEPVIGREPLEFPDPDAVALALTGARMIEMADAWRTLGCKVDRDIADFRRALAHALLHRGAPDAGEIGLLRSEMELAAAALVQNYTAQGYRATVLTGALMRLDRAVRALLQAGEGPSHD